MAKENKQEKHQRKWLENRDNEEEEETKMAKQEAREKQENKESKQNQELSESKIEQLNKQPIIETAIRKSDNGLFVIHRTIITDIKPVSYYEKVLEKK